MVWPNDPMAQEESIPSYITRLTQVPLLTPEEEAKLTRMARKGDSKAKSHLVEANMRLVINIARSFHSRSIPIEDLIQEGAIGLMHAVDRFEPDRGFRFTTYATHWIRQAIGRAVDNKSKAIRIPAHVAQCLRTVDKERMRLTRELGHEPNHDQLAAAMGLSPRKLQHVLQTAQDILSLDMQVGDGDSTTLAHLLKDNTLENPVDTAINREMASELHTVMMELNERERRVMSNRIKMDTSGDGLEREELAREMQVSRERIRQMEIQAIKKLRILAERRRLRELLAD